MAIAQMLMGCNTAAIQPVEMPVRLFALRIPGVRDHRPGHREISHVPRIYTQPMLNRSRRDQPVRDRQRSPLLLRKRRNLSPYRNRLAPNIQYSASKLVVQSPKPCRQFRFPASVRQAQYPFRDLSDRDHAQEDLIRKMSRHHRSNSLISAASIQLR